jgi:hypothetical protein
LLRKNVTTICITIPSNSLNLHDSNNQKNQEVSNRIAQQLPYECKLKKRGLQPRSVHLLAKQGKLLTSGELIKLYLIAGAHAMCPGKINALKTISLLARTVA